MPRTLRSVLCKHHRKFLSLAFAILVSATASVARADEARDAYRAGQDQLKEHKTLAALRSFERAVSLDPESSRYRDALEKTRDLALGEAVKYASQFAASDFVALAKLHAVCLQIDAKDPRTAEVGNIVLQARLGIESQIAQAKEKARGGDLAGARALLEPLRRYREYFESLSVAENELEFRGYLQAVQDSTKQGNFKSALEMVQKAVSLRPNDPEAVSAQAAVADALVGRMKPLITEKANSGHLDGMGLAIYATEEVERICPPCRGRLVDVGKLRVDYERGTLTLLAQMAKGKTKASQWAACGGVAEARLVFGADHRSALDSYCTQSGRGSGLTVGLSVSAPDYCSTNDLKAAVEGALPAGSVVTPVTTVSGAAIQGLDLLISVKIDDCRVDSSGDSEVNTKTSSYVAGKQQLANPEYVQIESQLRSAQIDQARLQQATRSNPNDLGSSVALLAVSIRVNTLSSKLRNTSPYTESSIEVPYKYEEFKAGISAVEEGGITFSDPVNPRVSSSMPLRAAYESWEPGIRGVYPQDSRGLRNREPALPGRDIVLAATLKDLKEQVSRRVSEVVPVWLAAEASIALTARRPFDALGYLTLLRIAKVSDKDPDLLRLQKEELTGLLLSVSEVEAHRKTLSVFEARVKVPTEASSPAVNSGKRQFLGEALKSVVSIRRGAIMGTGFVVSSSGLIVTNYHVVEEAGKIEVETNEGEVFLASAIKQYPEKDLALLRIPASHLPFLRLASSSETEVGEDVYALGSPRGLQGTVTKGIISAKRRLGGIKLLQIDAPINPGNSGGPLLLNDGRVVGVNTLRLKDSEGLNFAISIDEVRSAFGVLEQ